MTFRNDNKMNSNLATNLDNVAYESKVRFREPGDTKSRKQCDLCFSLSNLALIVASITGLFFLIVFFYDEPLNSYLDVLISTAFYRQLVFITVVIPLVLLIPIFNAISSLFLRNSTQLYTNYTVLIVKIAYISLLAILVFIGLIFMIPYVNKTSVASQLDLEFLHHMARRYQNQFSFQFLDDVQLSYQCCDILWYRANNGDPRLPISCADKRLAFEPSPYIQTCPTVLGALIALRCMIIAICLLVILISLIALVVIGICELMGQEYNVAHREEYYRRMNGVKGIRHIDDDMVVDETQNDSTNNRLPTTHGALSHSPLVTPHIDDDVIGDEISDRLRLDERERETPLLSTRNQQYHGSERRTEKPPPILTRANFTNIDDHRRQSPSFVDNTERSMRNEDSLRRPRPSQSPGKSSLKKSPSNGLIDSDIDTEDTESVHEYLREVQTRRSSMNVRFNIK